MGPGVEAEVPQVTMDRAPRRPEVPGRGRSPSLAHRLLVPVRLLLPAALAVGGLWLSLGHGSVLGWLLMLPAVGVAVVGVEGFVPERAGGLRPLLGHAAAWILPTLTVVAGELFLRYSLPPAWRWMGLGVTGVLLFLGYLVESVHNPSRHWALLSGRLVLQVTTYAVAFAGFAGLYDAELRGLQRAAAVALLALLLGLEGMRQTGLGLGPTWGHAALGALVLGELSLGLDYLPLGGWLGGATLLLGLHLLSGISQSHFLGRLHRGTLIEFGFVAGAGVLILVVALRGGGL